MAASGKNQTKTTRKKSPASGKRRKSTAKKTAAKKNTVKKGDALTPEEQEARKGIRDEILVIGVLAVSILMVLSTFNMCGQLGEWISYGLFGLFGRLAYIFPLLVFFGISFFVSNKNNRIAKVKLAASIFCYIFLIILFHMLTEPYIAGTKLWTSFTESAVSKRGGGLIGGVGSKVLYPLLGSVGSYVVLFLLILICMILITRKRFVIPFFRKSRSAYERAAKQHRERVQEKEKIREARLAEAREEKFGGRDLNFDLSSTLQKNEDEKGQKSESADTEGKVQTDKTVDKKRRKKAEISDFEAAVDSGEQVPEPADVDAIYGETLFVEEEPDFTVNRMEDIVPADMKEIHAEDFDDGNILEDAYPSDTGVYRKTIRENENIKTESAAAGTAAVSEQGKAQPEERKAVPAAAGKQPGVGTSAKAEAPSDMENLKTAQDIEQALNEKKEYVFPPMDLLVHGSSSGGTSEETLRKTAVKLRQTLESFGVKVQITNVSCGPSVTRYELSPEQGVKVSKIVSLSDDIKLNLAVADIRIEAPIPGKAAIGIEVPNKEKTMVMLRNLLESRNFQQKKGGIAFAVGRDIAGQAIVADIAKMPHLLVAGATGSGKSVCINTLIMSVIYKYKPEEVRLIMVDPKVVELSVYNGIPHLLIPVVTDPKKAAGALNWAVMEMDDRYKKFAELNVRDLKGYNEKVAATEPKSEDYPVLPQILIIIDELADLMMVAPGEVEDAICRLAQLARACGIHLVIATQRPSVNVITGLIKANIPSRIAFSVSSGVDSRTIIDMNGAEKLLGNGDMLFYPSGYQKPVRVQGAFVSDKEVNDVVSFLKEKADGDSYNETIVTKITSGAGSTAGGERDDYFVEAGKFIIEKDKASIGMIQRMFRVGFNRAARIMDQLADAGVVGPEEGTKPRKVLMSMEQFEQYVDEYV